MVFSEQGQAQKLKWATERARCLEGPLGVFFLLQRRCMTLPVTGGKEDQDLLGGLQVGDTQDLGLASRVGP